MEIFIYGLFSLANTLKLDGTTETNTATKSSNDAELQVEYMIVYDDYGTVGDDINEHENKCDNNQYEITVWVSGDLWSGTDDVVEICLYREDDSKTSWLELIKDSQDDAQDDAQNSRSHWLFTPLRDWFRSIIIWQFDHDIDNKIYDGFERLSKNVFCVQDFQNDFRENFHFKKIGIRKLGTDDMKIDTIMIRRNESIARFTLDRWITAYLREYILFSD